MAKARDTRNNDAPNGAAFIHMPVYLSNAWTGWDTGKEEKVQSPRSVIDGPITPDIKTPEQIRPSTKRKRVQIEDVRSHMMNAFGTFWTTAPNTMPQTPDPKINPFIAMYNPNLSYMAYLQAYFQMCGNQL